MTDLETLSTGLADTVEHIGKSLVRVAGNGRAYTGVVWATGVIVTTARAAEHSETAEVFGPDGVETTGTFAGADPGSGLAVIRADTGRATAPAIAEVSTVRPGQLVVVAARTPRLGAVRAALGIVGIVAEGWTTPTGGRLDPYIETDIAWSPGFAGGALANVGGKLIGVAIAAGRHRGGWLVPAHTVGQITDALLENGTLTRPYLGIGTQQVHLNGKLADSVGQDRALLVVHIDEDSPAAAADLRLGDALIGLNDGAIHGVHDLLGALAELKAGSKVSLSILRAEAPMEVSATLGTRPGGASPRSAVGGGGWTCPESELPRPPIVLPFG